MRILLSCLLVAAIGFGGAALAADKPAAKSDNASSSKTKVEPYPTEAVRALYDGCMKSKDLPADKAKAVCQCYGIMVQGTIPYTVFQKTNATMKTKGFAGLDDDGKAAMEKNAYDVNYCRLKHDAVGSAEERATFPQAALPALHASCLDFKDVPADRKEKFCGCYESLVRAKITYSAWQLLGLALQTKGLDQLDQDEIHTFDTVRSARLGCGGSPVK